MGKIIAFIPVRGGSKSIPLKNIKEICGKPLVYWNLFALEQTEEVDTIVVATDSEEIISVVKSFNFNKVIIYKRSPENASDTATTESVMLEYINHSQLSSDNTFMLVQATSPLTEAKHFAEALTLYKDSTFDSILTCVRNHRFFWNQDGTPKNYDYQNRPRRQDFEGNLMENGAFYINSVENILSTRNRLSGKIGIYEMPEYTSYEIDEPEDWDILENLLKRKITKSKDIQNQIKIVLTDVDGVLTDAGMYYSENGDELKKFNTHDGMAFKLLREMGIKTGIITSENTRIVENRAKKLKVDYLFQGKIENGKLGAAIQICEQEGVKIENVAYIGDDINCLQLLNAVGIAACPQNALRSIKDIPEILLLEKSGGEGVFREFVEYLINENRLNS